MAKSQKVVKEYVVCNLCGSDNSRLHMAIDGFNIVECKTCSLKYVNPRLTFDELEAIYKDETYFENSSFEGDDQTFYGYANYMIEKRDVIDTFRKRIKIIEKYKPDKGTLLDIGCALGYFLELAAARGWKPQGIEVNSTAAKYAQKHQKNPVKVTTLEDAKFKAHSFDCITMFDVIEHVPDPLGTIKEMYRVTKPGGVVALTTPDIGSTLAKLLGKRWEEVRRIREHIYFFSVPTLSKMLRTVGFRVVHVETAGRYLSLGSAVNRLRIYSPRLANVLVSLCKAIHMDKMKVFVNPRYKMTIYAHKPKAKK